MSKFSTEFQGYNKITPIGVKMPQIKIEQKYYDMLDLPSTASNYDFLKNLCWHGVKKLGLDKKENAQQYYDRLKRELETLRDLGFVDYIIIVWDVIKFCEENGIAVGLGRGCLHPDTEIVTRSRGFQKIKNIVNGDEVITHDGSWQRVINRFEYNCDEDLVKLNHEGYDQKQNSFTKDHKIFVLKNPFPSSSPPKSDFKIKEYLDCFDLEKCEWVQAGDIEEGDYIVRFCHELPLREQGKKIDLSQFSEEFSKEYIDAEDFYYLVGYMLGDGGLHKQKSRIGITFHSEDEQDQKQFKFFVNFCEKYGFNFYTKKHATKKLIELSIKSKALYKALNSIFWYDENHLKNFSNDLYTLPENLAEKVYLGLLHSDRCEKTERKQFDNVNLNIVNLFKFYVETLENKPYSIQIRDASKIKNGKYNSYKVRELAGQNNTKCVKKNGHFFFKVLSKECLKNDSKKVYDIEVENNHSYQTSNFVVHNSAAGSLVLNACGVTGVDPLKHELFFERFVSASRAEKIIDEETGEEYLNGGTLPDVDTDIDYYRRQEVIQYINEKYKGKSCKILTIGTLSGKLCIKEACKIVGEYSEEQAQHISEQIHSLYGKVAPLYNESEDEDKMGAFQFNEKFRKWAEKNKQIFSIARKIENLNKNYGVHASGVVISNFLLEDIMPTQLTKDKDLVSGYDMNWVAEMSIKFDALGLKTLSVIKDAAQMLGIDWREINVEDPFIYKQLQDLKYRMGLFQIEADTNYHVCCGVKPKGIDELSDVVALGRPGAMTFIGDYKKVKENPSLLETRHPVMDEILSKTKGFILYQEQAMAIANRVFGIDLKDTDRLRKVIGKKLADQMPAWKDKIYKQAEELNLDKSLADFFWRALEESGNYSFNKSHSISYAYLAAITTYLKFKHPKEFFLALLKMSVHEQDQQAIIQQITQELNYFNIKLLPPDLARSQIDFSIDGDNIRFGLKHIKGVSEKSLEKLIEFRETDTPTKIDIFLAAKQAGINIGVLSSLIQAGALSSFRDNRSRMVLEAQSFNILTDREKSRAIETIEQFDHDILLMLKKAVDRELICSDKKQFFLTEKRIQTFMKKYSEYKEIYRHNKSNEDFANWYFEMQLLGYSYSKNLRDIFGGKYHDLVNSNYIQNAENRATVEFIGTVSDSVKRKAKSGNSYMRLTLNDEFGTVNAMLCDNKRQARLADYIKAGGKIPDKKEIVYVKGQKSDGTVFIDDIQILDTKAFMKLSDLS